MGFCSRVVAGEDVNPGTTKVRASHFSIFTTDREPDANFLRMVSPVMKKRTPSSKCYSDYNEDCDGKVHRVDHVGIIVNDLHAAKAFFLDLGLEMMVDGEWAERIIGLQDGKAA